MISLLRTLSHQHRNHAIAVVMAAFVIQFTGEAQINGSLATGAVASSTQVVDRQQSSWRPVRRAADETDWVSVRSYTNSQTQQVRSETNRYVELATGLNVLGGDGRFRSADPKFQITTRGVECAGTKHHVILAPNIYSAGAVTVESEGQIIRSHPLCVGYWDPVDGRNVIFADVTNSVGWLVSSNVVVYSNCFNGLRASIRYRNSKAGLEQDLVLHEPPRITPEMLGFSPQTRLELFSELLPDTPIPQQEERTLTAEADPQLRNGMVEPDFTDATLKFAGKFQMGPGRAFTIGSTPNPRAGRETVPVGKKYLEIEGRKLLVEAVEFRRIRHLLTNLVASSRSGLLTNVSFSPIASNLMAKTSSRVLVPHTPGSTREESFRLPAKEQLHASLTTTEPAFVIDYELVPLNNNDYVFEEGKTYRVSGQVFINNATFMGGSVIKYDSWDTLASVSIQQSAKFKASATSPVIFTTRNDDTVGIPLNLGLPDADRYGNPVLILNGTVEDLKHFRITQAAEGIHFNNGVPNTVTHAQILHTWMPFYSANNSISIVLRNVLLNAVDEVFWGDYASAQAEYITAHGLFNVGSLPTQTHLINSLIVASGEASDGYDVQSTTWLTDDAPVFQTVGAGSHYLADDQYRTAADPARISDGAFLDEIRQGTTQPPEVKDQLLAQDLILTPRDIRDLDAQNLGYHYPVAIDYALNVGICAQKKLTISGGCNIATFGSYAIWIEGGEFISEGLPQAPNRIFPYTVQEQSMFWGGDPAAYGTLFITYSASAPPSRARLRFRFTHFEWPRRNYEFFHSSDTWTLGTLDLQDCEFHGGGFYLEDSSYSTYGPSDILLKNNLFVGTSFTIWNGSGGLSLSAFNDTFIGCNHSLYQLTNPVWTFRDNIFDHPGSPLDVWADPPSLLLNSHNAYVGTADRLPSSSGNDVTSISSISYENVPSMGSYYLPLQINGQSDPLLSAGSRTPTSAGLFHHTTRTDQLKEGTKTPIDIGFHYVALHNGVPWDSDGDGLADAVEDKNGNNSQDSGETSHTNPHSDDDGIDDGSEVNLGLDPLVNQLNTEGLRRNYIYDLNNRLKNVTGKGQVGITYDNEGNIKTVTQ